MWVSSLLIEEALWNGVIAAVFHLVRGLDSLVENGRVGPIISVAADMPCVERVRDLAFRDCLGFRLVKSL